MTDDGAHARLTAALGGLTAVVLVLGVVVAADRQESAPARTPEEAARRLFQASVDGDCDEVLDLMTPEYRRQIESVHAAFGFPLCASLRAERGAKLLSVQVRAQDRDRAVVVVLIDIPGDDDLTTGLLVFERRGGRWLNADDEFDCADPPGADVEDCWRYDLS